MSDTEKNEPVDFAAQLAKDLAPLLPIAAEGYDVYVAGYDDNGHPIVVRGPRRVHESE